MSDNEGISDEEVKPRYDATNKIPGAPGVVTVREDPAAPSAQVSSKRQSLSDVFTIFCAGFALISDGYQNNLMYVTAMTPVRDMGYGASEVAHESQESVTTSYSAGSMSMILS